LQIRQSPTYIRNVPELCAGCHRDGASAARRYLGPEDHIIEHYSMSIHGKGLTESGLTVTAVCTDCHTAHRELPAADPDSSVHEEQIASTCGRCHDGIYEQFNESIHSRQGNPDYVQLRGMPELPHCNDCHSSHTMARTDLPGFQLGIMEQCGHCHEEITESYFETYHGKASALGDTTKAKCYDCHGAHEILPPHDPGSLLYEDRIVETCAQCHEGAHTQFAGYLTHATHNDPERYPALYYAFIGMTTLLIAVFAFFGAHTLAWLPRSWKLRKQYKEELSAIAPAEKQFLRFTSFQRALHLTVILSFFGLAITGMILKFSHMGWAQFLSRMVGGAETAGWIHRVCAIATFSYMGLHLWDVGRRFKRSGKSARQFLFGHDSLVPKPADVREFWATIKWFVGKGPVPHYGRWTYWEKFDYFAVFWGVVIIGSTGLCLWFPELFTHVLPGWSINVATIIHSDEALLATGFIFTIHFFNTHFRPEKFPLDPVIFTGRMRVRELMHDRPRLYARLVESGELERRMVEPAPQFFERVVMGFGFTALAIGFTLIALIVYAMFIA
jgi:cytochrome b subunit of formate dehydrogenase